MAFPVPLILSAALPSELLSYILQYEAYPTTLIICYPRGDFLSSLISDVQEQSLAHSDDNYSQNLVPPDLAPDSAPSPLPSTAATAALLSTRLYQVAIARHIRMVFVPTVSHLRAYLSVFKPAADSSSSSSKVPPPPTGTAWGKQQHHHQQQRRPPLLLVYGFLALHRDTSEWSAQGMTGTAAALVEASRTSGFRAVVVEPPRLGGAVSSGEEEGDELDAQMEGATFSGDGPMLAEEMPVLSASITRAGGDFDDAAWTGRKVTVGRVLGRWFRYKSRQWSKNPVNSGRRTHSIEN